MNATYAKEINCAVCAYLMDHPVDACPVCGEPFYWLILPRVSPQEPQKRAFFQIMEDVVEGSVDWDFLQHGDHLWLPHNFWQYCPDGNILESFPWILDIRLVQRPNPQKQKFFVDKPKSEEPIQEALESESPDSSIPDPTDASGDSHPIPLTSPSPSAKPQAPPNQFVIVPNQWNWDLIFRPLMIALFFVFLAASYFALLFHRNTRALPPEQNAEVTHEKQILP